MSHWIFERLGAEFKGRAGHFYLTNKDLTEFKLDEWIECFRKMNMTPEQLEEFKNGFTKGREKK